MVNVNDASVTIKGLTKEVGAEIALALETWCESVAQNGGNVTDILYSTVMSVSHVLGMEGIDVDLEKLSNEISKGYLSDDVLQLDDDDDDLPFC